MYKCNSVYFNFQIYAKLISFTPTKYFLSLLNTTLCIASMDCSCFKVYMQKYKNKKLY